jgi:hypothetical protein
VDVRVHAKVGALSCRLQYGEADSKIFGQVVQEVSQGITCWDKAPRQKFPAAALHCIMIHDRSRLVGLPCE